MIEFSADGRTAPGWLSLPEGGAKGPGVLVIQEYWGLVDHIKDVTCRFAAEGFVALAPDLYHGDKTTSSDEAGRKLMALDIARAGEELVGAARYLLALPEVEPKKVAAVGFCMGGQLALYGATITADICAAVNFYGIHPNVRPDFTKLRGPVQAHFAERDEYVSLDSARALVRDIEAAGGDVQAHYYGSGHAFFNDARPEAYYEPDARLAWTRTLAFLRDALAPA